MKASPKDNSCHRHDDEMAASLFNMGSFGKRINSQEIEDENIFRMPFFILKTPDVN